MKLFKNSIKKIKTLIPEPVLKDSPRATNSKSKTNTINTETTEKKESDQKTLQSATKTETSMDSYKDMDTEESNNKLKRKIKLKVAKENVNQTFKKNYQKVRQNAKVTGFRPGKAPLEALRNSKYYSDIWERTLEMLIREFYPEALKKKGILPVSEPKILHIHLKEDHPASFDLEVEVHPEVKLKKYLNLQVKKQSTAVTKKQLDQYLETLKNYASSIEDAEKEEILRKGFLGNFEIEAEYENKKKCHFMCSKETLFPIDHSPIAPGFETHLTGMKVGELRKFPFSFPENYKGSRLSGKTLLFKVQLKNIKKEVFPELNDEFAKELKMQNLKELKENITKEIKKENEQKAKEFLKDSIVKELINKNPLPLPEALVEEERAEILKRAKSRLETYKLPEEEIKRLLEGQKKDMEKSARQNVHAHYLLKALIDELQIKVSNEEVELILKKHGASNPKKTDDVSKEDARHSIIWSLSVNKVFDSLLEKAEILEPSDENSKETSSTEKPINH